MRAGKQAITKAWMRGISHEEHRMELETTVGGELWSALVELAEERGTQPQELVRRAVAQFVDEEEEKHPPREGEELYE
jgi:hypothetical protein